MTRPDAGVGLPRKVTTNMAYQHLPMSFTSNHFTGHQHEPPHLLSLLTRHISQLSVFLAKPTPFRPTGVRDRSEDRSVQGEQRKKCSEVLPSRARSPGLHILPNGMRIRVALCGSDTPASNLFPLLANPPPPPKVQSIPCTSAMWSSSLSLASSRWKTLPGIPVCRPTLA